MPSGALAIGSIHPNLVVTRLSPAATAHVAVGIVRADAERTIQRSHPVPVAAVRLHVSPTQGIRGAESAPIWIDFGV